jgi:hypothetical protein
MNLAKKFCVIRDHGKVQGPAQLYGARSLAAIGPGLYADSLSTGKTVGLFRGRSGILGARIQRVARVDVQIPEEGLHQWLLGGAGLTLFRVLNGITVKGDYSK